MGIYHVEAPASPLDAMNSPFDGPLFPYSEPFIRVAGIIIEESELIVGRHCNRQTYEILGGTAEIGEDLLKALAREISEEALIDIDIDDVEFFGYFFGRADGNYRPMMMAAWIIGSYEGTIRRNWEIANIARITSTSGLPKGSTLEREIIPDLLSNRRIH